MLRTCLVAIIIVLGVGNAFCQQPSQNVASPVCSFNELFRKDGWTVPGVLGAKAIKQRGKLSNIEGVFVTMLQPGEVEANLTDLQFDQDHKGRVEIEDLPIKILQLWSFDFGGQVFAYRVMYAREALEGGKREELAAAATVFFYDMDGTGKFTAMRWPKLEKSTGFGNLPEIIPDWVKDHRSDAPSQP
jgi:hypothetical protein